MDPQTPDAEWIRRARGGDAEAFSALCRRHEARLRARVRRALTRALERQVSVADVMQESLLTAHARLAEFEPRGEGAFGAWLAQIGAWKAREAARHHLGAARRDVRRERPGLPPEALAKRSSATPSRAAMALEQRAAVLRALGDLAPDDRQVLTLVQLDQVPLREAAVLMSRSYEAVKKLYGRAVVHLGSALRRRASAQPPRSP